MSIAQSPSSALSLQKTPPDLKWLLNERAVAAGRLSKEEARQGHLRKQEAHTKARLAFIQEKLAVAERIHQQAARTLQALDKTIAVAHHLANPAAAGKVNAFAGKYGARGGLTEFLSNTLKASAPLPLTTSVLMSLTIRHFGLAVPTPADRRGVKHSVRTILLRLQTRGAVTHLHEGTRVSSSSSWRWNEASNIAGMLQALPAECCFRPESVNGTQQDTTGREVGGK